MPGPVAAFFGHHKCATDWLLRVLTQLCDSAGIRYFHTHWPLRLPMNFHRVPPFDERIRQSRAFAAAGGYDFLIATNADRELADSLESRGVRGFHIIRDPRDIVVSGYFSHLATHRVHPDENPWLIPHRERLRAAGSPEEGLLLELDYCATYLERLARWDYGRPYILETRFEVVTVNPHAELRRLLEFCGGAAGGAYDAILEANSFDKLSGGRKPGEASEASHLRKGIAGDWKNHFTPAVTGKFKSLYPGLVPALGYEADDAW